MALTCQVVLNTTAYQAGQTPTPVASIQVYNPNATAVTVTGLEMVYTDPQGNTQRPPIAQSIPPIGVGQTTTAPALSSIFIGPIYLAIGSAAAASSYQMVPPGAVPANTQGAQPLQSQLFIGARVYGSDGSVNSAGSAGLLVSYSVAPPQAYQGGYAQFSAPNNAVLIAAGVG